jgi:hypothetical protein
MIRVNHLIFFCSAVVSSLYSSAPQKVFPNAPNVSGAKWNVSLQGNFLYWVATEDGLEFCETSNGSTTTVREAAYHFDPGYKVAFSLFPNFDGADITFRFTWFNQPQRTRTYQDDDSVTCENNPDKKICNIEPFGSSTFFEDLFIAEDINLASAKWGLQLSEADAEIGKRYKISKRLYLRPYMGVKAIWQKQTLDINYSSFLIFPAFDVQESIYSQQNTIGIGPRIGMDYKFRFTKQIGFSANTAFSNVSTRFKTTSYDQSSFLGDTPDSNFNLRNNVSATQPVIELLLGMDIDQYFFKSRYHVGTFIGWEFHYFGKNNHLIVTPEDFREGDLSIQGLNFKLQFDF